jgi:hypothetical protein
MFYYHMDNDDDEYIAESGYGGTVKLLSLDRLPNKATFSKGSPGFSAEVDYRHK